MNTTTDSGTQPFFVKTQDAPALSQGLGQAQIFVDAAKSNGQFWLGLFEELPGFMTGLHYHDDQDEWVYILDGVLSVFIQDQWHDLTPGTFAFLPKGIPHAQGNTSNSPVRFLGSGNPAGFEGIFPELDAIAKRVTPNTPEFGKEVVEMVKRYGTTTIAPPPRR